QLEYLGLAGLQMQNVVCRHLCAGFIRINGGLVLPNYVLVESIFYVRRAIVSIVKTSIVGFIFCKDEFRLVSGEQPAFAVLPVLQLRGKNSVDGSRCPNQWASQVHAPRPGIAEPK